MFDESTIQICLIAYHGLLLSNFFCDFIARMAVNMYFRPSIVVFVYLTLGIMFFCSSIWAIRSIWLKTKKSLLGSMILLIVILVLRIIPIVYIWIVYDIRFFIVDKAFHISFIIEIIIHLFGICGTWYLYHRVMISYNQISS
jgi:hypothetical protein